MTQIPIDTSKKDLTKNLLKNPKIQQEKLTQQVLEKEEDG
jgi:hypothetical protein